MNELQAYNVNILKCRMLLMPMIIGEHCSLLVLYNPLLALSNEKTTKSFMMLLDTSRQPIATKNLLSHRVRSWLNRILENDDGTSNGNRFTDLNYRLHDPEGNTLVVDYLPFVLLSPANPRAVQKHHLIQDVGVYVLKHIHSILLLDSSIFLDHDSEDNYSAMLTRSGLFKFTPLDIWRMRSEMYIFIRRVAYLYKTHRVLDSALDKTLCSTPVIRDGYNIKVPSLLRYSYMTMMIEVGDMIEYKLRTDLSIGTSTPDSFVRRATVICIEEVENQNYSGQQSQSKTSLVVHLNNGEPIVNALHMVCRITMRCLHTGRPLWNPVRHWMELSSIHMSPSKVLKSPAAVVDMNEACSPVAPRDQVGVTCPEPDISPEEAAEDSLGTEEERVADPAPEMRDPDLIPVVNDMNRSTIDRSHFQRDNKREANRLDSNRSGYIGTYLAWLPVASMLTETSYLNQLYRTCMKYGDSASFYKLLNIKNEKAYTAEKKRVDRRMKDRETKFCWSFLNILMPLCFFSKFILPNSGHDATVINDMQPDNTQTLRQQKRTEGTLEFEYQNSQLKIRLCTTCREHHLVEVKRVIQPADTYTCSKCTKLDVNAYVELRLQPIWYERIEGAESHRDYKRDQFGAKIVRYDIPEVLLSLTVAEQLLIRRCAPFIPSFHIGKGFYGIKGHCVAFAQDITTMAKVLPRRPESVVTFVRAMGNKDTTELKLKHLKVSRDRVVAALHWLKIHHQGYRDIDIDEGRLDWMNGKDTAIIKGTHRKLVFDDKANPTSKAFVSKVQCAGDHMHEDELDYSIFGMSNGNTVPIEKSDDIDQLINASENAHHGKDKLMLFPPHGEKPIRQVLWN